MYCFLNFHLVRLPLYLWVQSLNCVPLCKPLDCSPPCSCIHGIFQARILEWVAISFPRRSSWPKDWTQFSCISFTGSQITTEPPCSSSCSVTSHVQLFATPWIAAHQTSCPSLFPAVAQTHVHRVSDAIQPSHPLSPLLLPPSVFPSIRVFSNESTLYIRWPKYWSFCFSINPSKWIFRVDFL